MSYHPHEGDQETISLADFLSEMTTTLPQPSFHKYPLSLYLYLCLHCGYWDISNGIAETFGTLRHGPHVRTAPCERCGRAPMHLVRRDERLYVMVETEQEETYE